MQRQCAVDDRVNAAPKRGGLSEELHAHRFATVLAPIKTKSPTSPPFRNTLMTVCALPELPSLCPIKPNSSSSNTVTTSVNDNGASVTVNRLSGTDRTLPATPTSTASRREQLRLPSSFPNKVCGTAAAAPPLAALPVQSSQPISFVTRSGRAASPPPPLIRSNVDTSANDATVATATSVTSGWNFGGSQAPFALRESTLQPSRHIAFVLNTHGEAGDLACAPAVAAPELRHRRALTHRGDPVLHSELGMYQLEHLDSGGKLQQRLTSFYHYCTEELTSAEDDTEGVPANRPCPFLPESRQFREYVVGDIDRSYGVVNTAVTLSAKEEQPALQVGSVASDNGTETATLTGTVVNAVKESEAPSSSEVRESYQPLPGTVFESALCKAWVWKQKSRAEASYAVEAAGAAVMNSSSLPSLSLRSCLLSTLSPIVTSTILAEVSLAASVARGGNLPNPSEPKALAAKPSVHIPVNRNSASNATSCLVNASPPTFKARVKAGLQMGDMYDPHAPLTALQLAVCELCGAELVCRKTLWTSFLADRYELLAALVETSAFADCITNVVPLPGAFAVMLERNSAAMQRYFSLTLEQYLPWMADLYLAEYKPVLAPATKPKADGATGTSSATRRFHSVVRPPSSGAAAAAAALLDRRPAALKPLPNMKSFLKTCKSSRPSFSPPPSAQPTLVGASVLMKVSFIVLEELAIVARMQLPAVVANAMNLLMPGAASLTRDSLFTSFTQSASLVTVSDSTPMAGRVHEMSATAHSGSGTVASNGGGSSSGDGLLMAATGTVSDSASAYARTAGPVAAAAAAKEANSTALLQSRLLHHWNQPNRVSDAQPVLSDELLKTSEAGADTTRMSLAAAPALAALKAVRQRSSYERSRVWLKVLFKFFHGEQAYSFVNDSPIAMRNFLPLPHVSWERILLRSFTIVAWTEFHASVAASAASLWGFRERTRGSWQKSIPMWEQHQWDRALRNCEQEALNMAAAIHELWFLIREWWLQFMENVFRSTVPVALTPRAGSNGNNKRQSKAPCAASTAAAAPGVTPWPLCSTEAAMNPPTSLTMDADPGLVSIPRGTSASQNPAPRFPQERETLCGSLPSVPSSVEKLRSSSVTPSKSAGGSVAQLTLAPQVRPAPKRLDNTEAPRQLQPGSSSSLSGHSSDFLLSTRSVMNSESQPIPTHKERRSLAGQHQQQQTRLEKGKRATALPGIRLQTPGFVTLDQHKGQYGDAAADLAVNTSRLLVPPMTATISGFYKGHAADWDTVLLVRCESLTRAALAEQEAFERQLLRRMRNAGVASLDTCGAMEARIAAEEDIWLIHRRNTARYLWDQVAMEKHLHLRSWVLERAQMSFISTAVLSHESLAELQLDTRIRLEEDFHLLIRETRSWGPPIVAAAAAASAQLLQQLPWSQMQHKLRTAAMALGSSNANSIPDEMSVAERRVFLKGKTDSKLMQAWETARGSMNKTFHFWGYGAFLPRADSPVGFNDGLVVMSRLCRDMRLRGRRLRTHWIVDVGNDEDDEPSLNFNDIHYANHDTYTGFTYVQLSGTPVQDEQAESVPEEVHTPRKRVNSLTDIHREGEDGAGQLLRHGLGNYASKTLGYTYVGGWHMDCPHGDGGLLFNGVLPWASCSEMGKKSLLLIFGRWEHGSLAQVELMFSGVPLS